mmetsp:Transcript_49027/g.102365  ORF Transcript_49027/g.102365 Transcript_49027/m.102365 type:complete len:115 (+) Transcript_49027:125-469(+)
MCHKNSKKQRPKWGMHRPPSQRLSRFLGNRQSKSRTQPRLLASRRKIIAKTIQSFCIVYIVQSLISALPSLPKFAECMLLVIPPIVPFLSPLLTPVRDFIRNQVLKRNETKATS